MFNKTKIQLSTLALTLSLSSAVLANELMINGSFENFTVSKDSGRWKLVQFDHWQGNGEVWTNALGRKATDGDYKIELDVGRELNTLSQTITTVADQKYRFSLDAYARRRNSSDFEIRVDGNVIATVKPDRKWAKYAVYFIASGGEQTISINELARQNNGLGTVIDNVSLEESQELLVNGSFEDFTIKHDHGRWKEVNFTAWEGAGEVWNNRLGKRSTMGGYKIELDVGRELNTLSQTVTTEKNVEYELSLDAYARRKKSSDVEIWLDNEKLTTLTPNHTRWDRYRVKFYGNGLAQKISLKEVASQNNGLGTVIDNVSLLATGETQNTNNAPTISGSAITSLTIGDNYTFTPVAEDSDSDTLTFSIKNQPTWASFDAATGILSGIADSEATYANIVISVSDGVETISLPAFSITVKKPQPAVNVAQKFGKASQGGTYGQEYAIRAIDGDNSTYNHTSCNATGNWWQVALPSPTRIAKLSIRSRTDRTDRIEGATVYISNTAYNGSLNASDKVATLQRVTGDQITTFTTPRSGNYLIIKAAGSQCLHMEEVQVYGEMPAAPNFESHEKNYLIQGSSAIGETIATLNASDYQGDTLSYQLIGDVPFSIDAQGNLQVKETLKAGSYRVVVAVSDGTNTTKTTLTIQVTAATAVSDAITSGDVSKVTEQELIQATLDEIEASKNDLLSAKVKIFNLNADGSAKADGSSLTAIDWNPTHDASLFSATLGKNTPLLMTNAVTATGKTIYNKDIAIIGEKGAGRYLVMGANPLRVTGNAQMDQVMENAISWLTKRDDLKNAPVNIVISHLDESYWFKDESKTRAWLDQQYAGQVKYNTANACDASSLSACLKNDTDLLIISQVATAGDDLDAIATQVNQALQRGISVLYIHHDGDQKALGNTLFSSVFDVTYHWDNYWKKLSLSGYNPTNTMGQLSTDMEQVKTLFQHFKQQDYGFNWSQCETENCNSVTGLQSEFTAGATIVRNMMRSFDANKKNIFNETGYPLQKLFALTGDKFRQGVRFPMDKVTTDDTQFMKSYYADYAVYNSRLINPAQTDMG
ncbi:MAG: ImpA family metalloprotease, partial [Cocleimonas sp.]|nr:ImpA family metalloprotease [Cocleimonas sp.]